MGKGLKTLRPSIVTKFPKNLEYSTAKQVYWAFSEWIKTSIYPNVVQRCPIYKGVPDERRENSGFLRNSLRIIISKGSHDIPFSTISVPNARPGTQGYRALMALYSMHDTARAHFVITPKKGKFLTFPVEKGSWRGKTVHGPGRTTGPKNWVIIKKATQTKHKYNPFIYKIAKEKNKELTYFLKKAIRGEYYIKWEKKKYELT